MEKHGNDVSSREEEKLASFLRNRNLVHANEISREVHPKDTFYSNYGKRILDLLIVIPILIVISPLLLLLSLLNMINLGRPILYRQTRYGYKGRYFDILKFRSMKNTKDSEGRMLPPERRLTPYGRFIRKYSLDELPNLLNVLKGDMSIIGPRGVPIFYMECMTERHKMMSAVRPGLECPRMISLENNGIMTDYHLTFENNIWYVENISFMTDVKMILKLVQMVFAIKERGEHAGALAYFVGYDDNGIALYTDLAKEIYSEELKMEKDIL